MSYDAINGPENVLQAPLTSSANMQQNSTNAKLLEKAIEDSAFYSKAAQPEVKADTTAKPAVADTAKAAPAAEKKAK